ncbi:amidohydrolase [Gryllotalpicola koreensis]|uniref:Amidohydrolase 3 domain-containing protein n=1 Tax=Gryllotalpicola koreensis TaxID=993086 RepID=A0ABP7ZSS2_9MICO
MATKAATTVYRPHHVITLNPDAPHAEAFAVRNGRICAIGELAEVLAAVPKSTPVEELDGVVLPGLIDAHMHLQRGGLKALDYLGPDDDVEAFIIAMHDSFDDDGPAHPPFGDRIRAIERVQPLLHALGFTGVIDPAVTPDELRGYRAAHARGLLTMRTLAMPYLEIGVPGIPDVDAVIARLDGVGVATGFGDEMLRLGPIKVYADGEALAGQALLEEPWDDAGYRGLQRIDTTEYERLVTWCASHGWGVGAHAVGGAAVALVVAAAERAGADVRGLRFQAIHAYLEPSAEAMRRAAATGVVASLQPSIIWHNGAGLRRALGERAETANPVRSWLDAGACVAFGSDGPYFAFDPRHLMWQAATRRIEGEERPLDASEAISIDEALAAYTTGAAYAALAEHERGALRPGYRADWALWSADPTTVPIDEVRSLIVLRTDVGGRTVHRKENP